MITKLSKLNKIFELSFTNCFLFFFFFQTSRGSRKNLVSICCLHHSLVKGVFQKRLFLFNLPVNSLLQLIKDICFCPSSPFRHLLLCVCLCVCWHIDNWSMLLKLFTIVAKDPMSVLICFQEGLHRATKEFIGTIFHDVRSVFHPLCFIVFVGSFIRSWLLVTHYHPEAVNSIIVYSLSLWKCLYPVTDTLFRERECFITLSFNGIGRDQIPGWLRISFAECVRC